MVNPPETPSSAFIPEQARSAQADLFFCRLNQVPFSGLREDFSTGAILVREDRSLPQARVSASVSALFDRGTIKIPEDRAVIAPPFFGAFDGTSGVFWEGGNEACDYNGLSGGQMAASLAAEAFAAASPHAPIEEVLDSVNKKIAARHALLGLDVSIGGNLGGTVGAVGVITPEVVRILQWGDCFAAWKLKDGTTGMTANQTAVHEHEMLKKITDLMEAASRELHTEDPGTLRKEMWRQFGPFLQEKRTERINNLSAGGYGFLCGQDNFLGCTTCIELPAREINTLVLSTDGLVPFVDTGNPQQLAREIMERLSRGGFDEVLRHQRLCEDEKTNRSHVSHTEAASLSIVFK